MALSVSRSATSAIRRVFTSLPSRSLRPFRRHLPSTAPYLAPHKIARTMSVLTGGAEAATTGVYSTVSGTEWTVELMPSTFPETVIATGEIGSYETELLAIGVFADIFEVTKNEDGTETVTCTSDSLMSNDAVLNGALTDILAKGDFKGESGQSAVVRAGGKVKNIGLFGLGKQGEATLIPKWGRSVFHKFGGAVATSAKGLKAATVSVVFETFPEGSLAEVTSQLLKTTLLDAYESTRYKEKAKKNPLKTVSLMNFDAAAQSGVEKAYAVVKGTNLAQYLVESPPNVCYPQHLADAAQMIAAKFPDNFTLKVLEKDECAKMGMGLYLGVAEASNAPPKFIHLAYSKGTPKETLAFVGKGITFDSGGYNLKVNGRIEDMKFDMGGAGAALGAAYIIGSLAPDNTTAHFIVASCENMIAGNGYRPGDIITASNGKSVEVINTDAEGRLTLADALLYAQNECKATSIINMATLTGAIIIALGEKIAGMFTPSDAMAADLVAASQRTGDRLWRMPLEEEYLEMLTKGIADLKNVGSRYGGSITAGLFLKEFVKTEDVQWAHIDIAGTAWSSDKGVATGYGAALFAEWALAKTQS